MYSYGLKCILDVLVFSLNYVHKKSLSNPMIVLYNCPICGSYTVASKLNIQAKGKILLLCHSAVHGIHWGFCIETGLIRCYILFSF